MTPDNVRRALLILFLCVVGAAIYFANHEETQHVGGRVTKIERQSPCLEDEDSLACKKAHNASARQTTVDQACYYIHLAGLNSEKCRKHGREQRRKVRRREANASQKATPKEVATAIRELEPKTQSGSEPPSVGAPLKPVALWRRWRRRRRRRRPQ